MPAAELWSGTSIVNIPMGQGIAVTPMQMAVAFSTVANNGVQVTPHLVAQVGDARLGRGRVATRDPGQGGAPGPLHADHGRR